MRHLFKLLALLIITDVLCVIAKAGLPPGTIEAIKNNGVLLGIIKGKKCYLSGWGLSSEDIKGLVKAFQSNKTITTLDLSDNYLDNECYWEIQRIMEADCWLEYIDLSRNFMDKNTLDNIVVCAEELGWSRTGESGFCFTKEFEEESDFSDEDSVGIAGRKNKKWRGNGRPFRCGDKQHFPTEIIESEYENWQARRMAKRDSRERRQDFQKKEQNRESYD